jgi:hypothetical protein
VEESHNPTLFTHIRKVPQLIYTSAELPQPVQNGSNSIQQQCQVLQTSDRLHLHHHIQEVSYLSQHREVLIMQDVEMHRQIHAIQSIMESHISIHPLPKLSLSQARLQQMQD